jgi:hypothetical protein
MIPKSGHRFSDKIMRKTMWARCSRLTAAPQPNEKPHHDGGASVHFVRAALAFLALLALATLLAALAGLLATALLLLTRLAIAAALLTGLIALLLLARFLIRILVGILVGILVLRHFIFLQRCWRVWREDDFVTLRPVKQRLASSFVPFVAARRNLPARKFRSAAVVSSRKTRTLPNSAPT